MKLALFGLNGHVAGESRCTKSALSFFQVGLDCRLNCTGYGFQRLES